MKSEKFDSLVEKTKNAYHQIKKKATTALVIPVALTLASCNPNGYETNTYQVLNSSGEVVDASYSTSTHTLFGTTEKILIDNGEDKIKLYNTKQGNHTIEKMVINGETLRYEQKGVASAFKKGTADFITMRDQLNAHRNADAEYALSKGK